MSLNRMGLRGWFALVVVVSGTTGCLTSSPTPPSGSAQPGAPVAATSVSAASTATVDLPALEPGATLDPRVAADPALSCGDPDLAFAPQALSGPDGAQLAPDPAAQALRRFLAQPNDEALPFPDLGWRRVAQTQNKALFVAPGRGEVHLLMVALISGPNGWREDAYGECQLAPVFPDGISPATWWLDSQTGNPVPSDRRLAVWVHERACASGHSPEGRILPPVIVYGEDAVLITFGVRERPGGQDCQGTPPFPSNVDLAEPLGERRLLDGGVFPPREPVPDN